MKMIGFLPALVVCVYTDLFIAYLIFNAMVFHSGSITLNFDYYHEGWIEFAFVTLMGLVGTIGIIGLFKNWLNEKESFIWGRKWQMAIILCATSFFLVIAIIMLWIFLRG